MCAVLAIVWGKPWGPIGGNLPYFRRG